MIPWPLSKLLDKLLESLPIPTRVCASIGITLLLFSHYWTNWIQIPFFGLETSAIILLLMTTIIILIAIMSCNVFSKLSDINQLKKTSKSEIIWPKIECFRIGDLKWKAHIESNNVFKLDDAPICAIHDRMLINQCRTFDSDFWFCKQTDNNECIDTLTSEDYLLAKKSAISEIEHILRNRSSVLVNSVV